jgi:hypothetical protein
MFVIPDLKPSQPYNNVVELKNFDNSQFPMYLDAFPFQLSILYFGLNKKKMAQTFTV